VQFCCLTTNDGGNEHQVRLQNTTDATTVFGPDNYKLDSLSAINHSGWGEVTLSGVAKTFEIQFNALGGGTTTISQARITIWRVA